MTTHKLYGELSHWWPLFSPPEHYVEEAADFRDLLKSAVAPPPKTLVEFGSGGGNNAFHLKSDFAMTLVDPSPGMLAVSRALNPECEHVEGDMRTVRLNRLFDAVFVHDAIMYMTSEADLARAIETAYVHLKPGGAALFVPDFLRETFEPFTHHGGEDGEGRGLRYLEWCYDPNPEDSLVTFHFVFILKEGESVRIEHDAHTSGLFARADWERVMIDAGFARPRIVTDQYKRDLFVALKPSGLERAD